MFESIKRLMGWRADRLPSNWRHIVNSRDGQERTLSAHNAESTPLPILIIADSRQMVRVAAIAKAASEEREDCVDSLISTLNDDSEEIRRAAAGALLRIGIVRGLAAVVSGCRHGRGVRTQAAYLLKEIGPDAEQAIPGLVVLLNYSDINWRSRMAASLALAAIGAPAVPYLLHALEFGPDHARVQAAGALKDFGLAPDHREEIERVLEAEFGPSEETKNT